MERVSSIWKLKCTEEMGHKSVFFREVVLYLERALSQVHCITSFSIVLVI